MKTATIKKEDIDGMDLLELHKYLIEENGFSRALGFKCKAISANFFIFEEW